MLSDGKVIMKGMEGKKEIGPLSSIGCLANWVMIIKIIINLFVIIY